MLSLEIADESGTWIAEASTVLDEELLDYLASLSGFPALEALRDLDPAGETRFDEPAREALKRDVEALAPQVERRQVPEPPAYVGLEGTGDIRVGEEFGWAGLREFLRRLHRMLAMARQPGMEMWAVGE